MNCTLDKELFHLYIDGQLSPIEKMLLQEHLRMCPACSKELNQLKILDWDLKNEDVIDIPGELAALRENLVSTHCEVEKVAISERLEMRDIYQLQYNTMKNSLKFINYLPGKKLVDASSKVIKDSIKSSYKKKSFFSKIMGL